MMQEVKRYRFGRIRRPNKLVVLIGLLTAAAILLFQSVNLLVIYRYMQLDLYLSLVAVFFLALGLLASRRTGGVRLGERVTAEPEPLPNVNNETPTSDQMTEMPLDKTTDILELMGMLSAKEWQILQLVAEGKTNKEIAAAQFIELSTVKTHLNNIYNKLSVSNRKEARAKYAEIAPKWPTMA